ncbi:MAG: hypothetical protein KKI15_15855 [Proteobacteria bacterium]|nr:hypothetical protein [Pseudomonadota bacterium]
MKYLSIPTSKLLPLALLTAFCLQPAAAFADSCSEGVGIPPFLSAGVDPNLLLLIDNSGSMLDMAYVDDIGQCTDNTFDSTEDYAGLFDSDKWYKWTEGQQQWKSGTTYAAGAIVYSEGIFYKAAAASGNASVGYQIADDYRVDWAPLYEIPIWTQGETYAAKSFVQFDSQLYYTVAGGTALDNDFSDGVSIGGDSGVTWVAKDSSWLNGNSYTTGDIVSDNGMLFEAQSSGTASGTGVWDDVGVSWDRLDEGYFEEVDYDDVSDAVTAFAALDGDVYQQDDLYLRIVSVLDTVNVDDKGDPLNVMVESRLSAFAASGKMLNWASASKFDIQKKILTGGKYNPDAERLISQHRGCSGKGFIKEVPVKKGLVDSVITFSIKGTDSENWIDTTDDTMRLTIMGASTEGFISSDRAQSCQDAIDSIAAGYDDGQGTTKQNITDCLDYGGTNNILAESNSAYNHSLHTCWQMSTTNAKDLEQGKELSYQVPDDLGMITEVMNSCEHIYRLNMPPTAITPENSGYLCYGVYNDLIPDAKYLATVGSGSDRLGYVGRCWELGTVPEGCSLVPCTVGIADFEDPAGSKIWKRCLPDGNLYFCDNYNTGQGDCKNGYDWAVVIQDADGSDGLTCDTTQLVDIGGWSDADPPGINTVAGCIQSGLWDYCQGMTIPEVIDPSDDVFTTGDTWGMIGALIDSGVASMFGSDHALIVMKGYIKKDIKPEGVLHSVASDLRMGAMAFNDNGAKTECSAVDVNDTIVEYCPENNQDGARLIAPIKGGDAVTGGTVADPIHHVDDLTEAINDIRATAWTPLAEAVYNALGYYGQDTSRRLNPGDFYTAAEDPLFPDPVQNWCQENYLLVITEGASTADLNPDVLAMITAMGYEDSTVAIADEGECYDDDGTTELYGSTYLDDLTYFGQEADAADLFTTPAGVDPDGDGTFEHQGQIEDDDGVWHDKRNITTYIVTTGLLRDDGTTTSECNPATIIKNAAENGGSTLLTGEDPDQLEGNLLLIFSDILSRASAGSAASVISSSRSGEGGVYQAIFWPQIDRAVGEEPLVWTGDVHAFFINEDGFLWDDYSGADATPNAANQKGKLWTEDTNGNGVLDSGEDSNSNGVLDGDRRIITFYNDTTKTTQICFNSSVVEDGVCEPSDYIGTAVTTVELRDFDQYLWSANEQLEGISTFDASVNRSILADGTWNFGDNRRYIFTWNDLDNDGIVDSAEVLPFEEGMNTGLTVAASRQSVLNDFNVASDTKLNELINWLRGNNKAETTTDGTFTPYDVTEDENMNGVQDWVYRCRRYPDCALTSVDPVWRLGDVIHSTPTLVSRPAEGFQYIYRDDTYNTFYKKYVQRRQVIYFGANDGMLHAVNAGFYDVGENGFLPCAPDQRDADNNCNVGNYSALGDELWAYVPYNLQPHLACLSDPLYNHKYFVDAPPRIFDVRIFEEEAACSTGYDTDGCVHPGGWGTILVGYMRFGGAPLLADDSVIPIDNREFISSYFILDITDPEQPPTLLGEMTKTTDTHDYAGDGTAEDMYVDLGYTTSMPTMVTMRDDEGFSEWFLVLGNGPTTIKGENDQQGKVAVVPLNAITGVNWAVNKNGSYDATTKKPFRIPNEFPPSVADAPASPSVSNFGRYLVDEASSGEPSFISDLVTVDYNIGVDGVSGKGVPYKSDVVYFGTVDGSGFTTPLLEPDKTIWNGGGRMYRLVTNVSALVDGELEEQYSYPSQWYLDKFIDAKAPITAAANIGYDGDNYWIYFGTGRFFAPEDKTDDTQNYFFGVKEPFTGDCGFAWGEVSWEPDVDPNPALTAGSRGLFRSDQIRVVKHASSALYGGIIDFVYCADNDGIECGMPAGITPLSNTVVIDVSDTNPEVSDGIRKYYDFWNMEEYIVGEWCGTTDNPAIGVDGWYRNLYDPRERSLGMPTLLSELLLFSSYQPYSDICQAEGNSYLYGVYYSTGTAWIDTVFGTYLNNDPIKKTIVNDRLSLGKGLTGTPSLGVGTGSTAYVQSSTGEILEVSYEPPGGPPTSSRKSWTDR